MLALPAAAGPVDWAHQNGSVQSNGAVTVKSLSGGSYGATGNPTGAVAKANQNAATQPPTVIIQATSSGVFSYTSDCYILTFVGNGQTYVGAGKLDSSNNFTGITGSMGNGGGDLVMGALMGYSMFNSAGATGAKYYGICTTSSCLTSPTYSYNLVYTVIAMPTSTRQKCYP